MGFVIILHCVSLSHLLSGLTVFVIILHCVSLSRQRRCMHICQCHFLQLSRSGSDQAPSSQPIRGPSRWSSANQRPSISPAWGLRLFTDDKTRYTRKSKGANYLYLYPFTGKYIYIIRRRGIKEACSTCSTFQTRFVIQKTFSII